MSSASEVVAAAQAVTEALRAATPDPKDGVRMLANLATFASADPTTTDAVGIAIGVMRDSLGDALRRAALTSLARATAAYQPSSYDDAISLRDSVAVLFDDEILNAGDKGDDASYRALRELRSAIVADLTSRGGDLAKMVQVVTAATIPSLALAYQLYGDTTRVDELVGFADPPHPAFMPVSFRALSR
jgi:prophage DNA circulation protein